MVYRIAQHQYPDHYRSLSPAFGRLTYNGIEQGVQSQSEPVLLNNKTPSPAFGRRRSYLYAGTLDVIQP